LSWVEIIGSKVFLRWYPAQSECDLLPVITNHIAKWLKPTGRNALVIDLADHREVIAEYFDPSVSEKMVVEFYEFEKGKQASIFTFILHSFILSFESYAEFGNIETYETVEHRILIIFTSKTLKIAFHGGLRVFGSFGILICKRHTSKRSAGRLIW